MKARCLSLFIFLLCYGVVLKAQSALSSIDVLHYSFSLTLSDKNDSIAGTAAITLNFIKPAGYFRLNLVKANAKGRGMIVSSVTESGRKLQFVQNSDSLTIYTAAQQNSRHTYQINYAGIPADGLIISTNKYGHRTFFGDNWPNRAHNWLPCVDEPGDKATVDFMVTAPAHYQVIANGLKTEETVSADQQLKVTRYHETQPLSTKVMVIGVADFAIDHPGDVGAIPVYTYVFPEDKQQGFHDYAIAQQILPFYIKKIGLFAYEKLANVQSKTIFGGMENASAIFYFENSVGDRDIEALMAHEIAHQWFGDAASETSFLHLWLSEGFATYMTHAYLENKYGIQTLKDRLIADRKKVIAFEKRRYTPIVDTASKGDFMQLLNANSYEKGGWVLHMLRRKLGDEVFWKGIRAYFARYNGGNASTYNFYTVMEEVSGKKLHDFFKQWVLSAGHPQVKISQTYDADKKAVVVTLTQMQQNLFDFALEYTVDQEPKLRRVNISKQVTTIVIPSAAKTISIKPDPNVNLLAEFVIADGH